jgi:hypothetical protein
MSELKIPTIDRPLPGTSSYLITPCLAHLERAYRLFALYKHNYSNIIQLYFRPVMPIFLFEFRHENFILRSGD